MNIPKHDELYNALISALKNLGGTASVHEIEKEVSKILNLSEKDLSIRGPKPNRYLFSYRLAWARSFLKSAGIIDNVKRGTWTLTKEGSLTKYVNKKEINRETAAKIGKVKTQKNTK